MPRSVAAFQKTMGMDGCGGCGGGGGGGGGICHCALHALNIILNYWSVLSLIRTAVTVNV